MRIAFSRSHTRRINNYDAGAEPREPRETRHVEPRKTGNFSHSRRANANSNGIGNVIQLARRQFAQPVEKARFRDGFNLKSVGTWSLS